MIKPFFFLIVLVFLIKPVCFCQNYDFCIDSCGNDDILILNTHEANYFNLIFNDIRGNFNFIDKKAVYGEGFLGKHIRSKSYFFRRNANLLNYLNKYNKIHGGFYLLILNDNEKEITDLFDVIVIFGSKAIPTDNNRKQIILNFIEKN